LNDLNLVLVYANDIHLLGKNINTLRNKAESLIQIHTETGLEVNIDKTKYMNKVRNQYQQ